jgi:TetR/AcrR family transcriptional regulator, cholesterol catabolism regulator
VTSDERFCSALTLTIGGANGLTADGPGGYTTNRSFGKRDLARAGRCRDSNKFSSDFGGCSPPGQMCAPYRPVAWFACSSLRVMSLMHPDPNDERSVEGPSGTDGSPSPVETRTSSGHSPPFRNRQDILDAAARIFFEKGYSSASVKDIADDVGILKGSVYHHVSSKDEMLFEIIKQVHDLQVEITASVVGAGGSGLTKLRTLIVRHIEVSCEHVIPITVFLRELPYLSPDRRAQINQVGDIYRHTVRDVLLLGQGEGSIRKDLDCELVSLMLVEMLNSVNRWYRPDGRSSVSTIAEQYVHLLLPGLVVAE